MYSFVVDRAQSANKQTNKQTLQSMEHSAILYTTALYCGTLHSTQPCYHAVWLTGLKAPTNKQTLQSMEHSAILYTTVLYCGTLHSTQPCYHVLWLTGLKTTTN